MADNPVVDNGVLADFTVAADDIAGALYQYVKLAFGADGILNVVDSTHPIPVVDASLTKAEDAVHASGDLGVMTLGVRKDTATGLESNDGDYAPFLVDSSGRLHVNVGQVPAASRLTDSVAIAHQMDAIMQGLTARTPAWAAISGATNGNNTLVTAQGAGLKILVHSMTLVAAGAVSVKFQSGAGGTDLTGAMPIAANGGFELPFSPVGHFAPTAANTLLNMVLNAAVQVSGCLCYTAIS